MPVGEDSTIRVSLLRSVPGPNLDLATFSSQVPTKGSLCANANPEVQRSKARMAAAAGGRLREASLTFFPEDWHVTNCKTCMGRMPRANDDRRFIFATSKLSLKPHEHFLSGNRRAHVNNHCFTTTTSSSPVLLFTTAAPHSV